MGGSNVRQQQQNKKSSAAATLSSTSSAVLSVFKLAKRPGSSRKVEDSSWDDSMRYKVWPSDEDKGRYVARPGIDRDAAAYIAKFRAGTAAAET